MAPKHERTNGQGNAPVDVTLGESHSPTSKSTGTKRKSLADADQNQDRSAKRSKFKGKQPNEVGDNHPQAIKGKARMPHEGTVEASNRPNEHFSANKRQRDDGNAEDVSQTLSKRLKLKGNSDQKPGSESHSDAIQASKPSQHVANSVSNSVLAPVAQDELLPSEFHRLVDRYEVSTMSILSSAKIESRVRNLLERVQKFSFANTKAKPGIVVLRAKADVASKLCSIVELAKQQIGKEKGKWWQYNKLHGELFELKPREIKRTGGGMTLSKWSESQTREEITGSHATIGAKETPPTVGKKGGAIDEEEDDMEDSFEVMTNTKLRDRNATRPQSHDGKKVRNTPVMTVIFAMVPVPGLKEHYG